MLVVFEGLDAAGKKTQADKLVNRILTAKEEARQARMSEPAFCPATLFSFPDYEGSELGRKIRKYLKGEYGKLYSNHPLLVSALFAIERYEKQDDILEVLYHKQGTVICDRYTASNLAYQAGKVYDGTVNGNSQWLQILNDTALIEHDILGFPEPDLVIYLDLTAEQSYARSHKRDSDADAHQDDITYLNNVRCVYRYLAGTYNTWKTVPCFTADGRERTVEELHEEIWQAFADLARENERKLRRWF